MTKINTPATSLELNTRALRGDELDVVTGGSMMDLVNKAFADYLKNCLFKLTREGTIAICPLPK